MLQRTEWLVKTLQQSPIPSLLSTKAKTNKQTKTHTHTHKPPKQSTRMEQGMEEWNDNIGCRAREERTELHLIKEVERDSTAVCDQSTWGKVSRGEHSV